VPVRQSGDGIRLSVRVTPRASRNAVSGAGRDAEGQAFLKIMVTAPAEDGKANAAVKKLLARTCKVAKSAIVVTHGATGRRKTLQIAGDPHRLTAVIEDAIGKTAESTEHD
jgi:uncharacterized protein